MAILRYPVQLQALYSELLGRVQQAALEELADAHGGFAAKTVAGRRYWYFRRRQGKRIVERYVGPETADLLRRIDALAGAAGDAKAAARQRRDFVRLLRAGGVPVPDARSGRVLRALADAGVFRLRGVIVGTHAFLCYGAMLGVRIAAQAAFTTDIDVAQFETVSVAVGEHIDPGFEAALRTVEPFDPMPTLRSRLRSSSWRTPDRALTVELLTPLVGPTASKLVALPAFAAHGQPIRFLDYLIHRTEPAAVLHGSGILVNVPPPERYACHKLIVAHRRRGAGRAKAAKDIVQAAALFEVLLEDRPGDVEDAWSDLLQRGPKWRESAMASVRRLPGAIAAKLNAR